MFAYRKNWHHDLKAHFFQAMSKRLRHFYRTHIIPKWVWYRVYEIYDSCKSMMESSLPRIKQERLGKYPEIKIRIPERMYNINLDSKPWNTWAKRRFEEALNLCNIKKLPPIQWLEYISGKSIIQQVYYWSCGFEFDDDLDFEDKSLGYAWFLE